MIHQTFFLALELSQAASAPYLAVSAAKRYLGQVSYFLWGNIKSFLGDITAWGRTGSPSQDPWGSVTRTRRVSSLLSPVLDLTSSFASPWSFPMGVNGAICSLLWGMQRVAWGKLQREGQNYPPSIGGLQQRDLWGSFVSSAGLFPHYLSFWHCFQRHRICYWKQLAETNIWRQKARLQDLLTYYQGHKDRLLTCLPEAFSCFLFRC